MSINKTACRKFADRPLRIRPTDGLLHAPQIARLVRTAVKIIDRRRTLVLYVYTREAAANGNLSPKWTVFQTKDDFITLERKEDGSTAWRASGLDRLCGEWDFAKSCAFVSASDERRVARYFGDDTHRGFACLQARQSAIQERRRAERERQTARYISKRMRAVPAIPRGLHEWVRRHVMPAYFLYDYRKGSKTATGVCSACGGEIELTGAKHNAEGVCPRCKRPLTMKSRGRMGHLYARETCTVVQRTAPDELVIRIFKANYDYTKPAPEVRESARRFVRCMPNGTLTHEEFYASYGQWKKGRTPVFSYYRYSFEADACGHLYCGNLPGALKGTPWQHCPLKEFYEHFRERMEVRPFVGAYMTHPKLEHLIKTGFYNLASDLVYRNYPLYPLDETQNRTHRILGVEAEDIPFLRALDVDMHGLQIFAQYRGLKERHALLRWQLECGVERDIPEVLRRMTPHKMMRYLNRQRERPETQAQARRRTMQTLVSEYRDYLELCEKLGDDLTNSFVIYPRDLRQAHDRAARRLKFKADADLRRNFKTAYERVMSNLDFELNGLKIVCPAGPEEIAREGQALHHCVGGYVDRVARKECLILFLRHSDDLATPFYTVEVRERRAVQVRGMSNAEPTPEVRRFVAAWEKKVLQAA